MAEQEAGAFPQDRGGATRRAIMPGTHMMTTEGVRPHTTTGAAGTGPGAQHRPAQALSYHGTSSVASNFSNSRLLSQLSPRSKRQREAALEYAAIQEGSWFHPGRTRLKDVHPRRVLQRQKDAMEAKLGNDHFQSSAGKASVHKHRKNAVDLGVGYSISFSSAIEFSSGPSTSVPVPGCGVDMRPDVKPQMDVESDTESGTDEFHETGAGLQITRRTTYDYCEPRNHMSFLRKQVYSARCAEMGIKENSGIASLMDQSFAKGRCYCSFYDVSFRNFMIGDRGILALLPFLTFGRRLRFMSLAGNNLRQTSTRQLCSVLKDNFVLASLLVVDLSDNPLGAACGDAIQSLLSQRRGLLLVGLDGTQMAADRRQRLLRASLANFSTAEAVEAYEALRLASKDGRFMDMELLLRCKAHAARAFSRSPSPNRSGAGSRLSPSPDIDVPSRGEPEDAAAMRPATPRLQFPDPGGKT